MTPLQLGTGEYNLVRAIFFPLFFLSFLLTFFSHKKILPVRYAQILPPFCNLISVMRQMLFCSVVGDDCCGKTNLISKLRTPGEEELRKGAGLEYTYLDIHDEERDGMIDTTPNKEEYGPYMALI